MAGRHRSLLQRRALYRWGVPAALALAVAALIIVIQAQVPRHASALSIVVNSLADTSHIADNGDGGGTAANAVRDGTETIPTVCGTTGTPGAPTGPCTLRAAVYMANANGDTTDTITFDAALSGAIGVGSILPLGDCGTISGSSCGANGVVDGTTIDGTVSGTTLVITVDCGGAGGTAFDVTGGTNVIRDLNITDCIGTGGPNNDIAILITGEEADNNRVLGNYIGTNSTGTACGGFGNDTGIIINGGADSNQIGTATAGDRNVIGCSSNAGGSQGIIIDSSSSTGNIVRNNYIGTNRTGTAALANGTGVSDGGTGTIIDGNLISGNGFSGILALLGSGGTITGNTIGLQADGSTALGNGSAGVELDGTSSYTVGGTTAAARNVVSSNTDSGIILEGTAASNTVLGNYIGTDSSGTLDRGNGGYGVGIFETANANVVGGLRSDPVGCVTGPCNVISGNGLDGVGILGTASNNDIRGNNIGLGASGLSALGNGINGVYDASTSGNRLGGTTSTFAGSCLGVCNRIAYNTASGAAVLADGGTATLIRRNETFSNGDLGIDLDNDGLVNCPLDTGAPVANGGFPACPHISAAIYSSGTWTLSGNDGGAAGADVPLNSPVDIYEVLADPSGYGEGKRWLATALVDPSGNWSTSVCVTGPTTLSAVVTNEASGRSSEFGPNFDIGTGTCVLAPPPTSTPTVTSTPTITNTPLATATPTRTSTPTITPTPTVTNTPTNTATPTVTNTPTNTPVPPTNTPLPPTATRTSTPTPAKPCGDVNDDDRVNSVDAALILQLSAALISTLPNMPSADVNNDGSVNSVDAALILQKEAGLITSLNC